MERSSGSESSCSGRRITTKKSSLQQPSHGNQEPQIISHHALTFTANYAAPGSLKCSKAHINAQPFSLICGLPSANDMRTHVNYRGGLREPFVESGYMGHQSKVKKLKRKLDNVTQPLHTKTTWQSASCSQPTSLRSSDAFTASGVEQKQKSGANHGGKRPCREEECGEALIIPPLKSEPITCSSSSDCSLQPVLAENFYPIQNDPMSPSSPRSQPCCSTQQPTIHYIASNKTFITPSGNGFYPNQIEVVRCITRIIQSKFDGPWPTWNKVPINIRDYWFDELQKWYYWQPDHARQIRLNFEARGMARLSDMFCAARKELSIRPFWLSSEVWDVLKQYWESPKFKKISEQAKINRASDCDGFGPSLHTCDSIPMPEHKRHLEEETGEEVTPSKLFVHTHQRKDKTCVDTGSSRAYEKFVEWNAQKSSENPINLGNQGEGQTSAQLTQPTTQLLEADVWVKANLTKKGIIYGPGSEGVNYKHPDPWTSQLKERTPLWFDTPEFQEFFRKKVMEISSDWNARLEEECRRTEELRKRVAELEKQKQEKKSKKAAKKKMQQMKEMMRVLKKSYESLSKAHFGGGDDDDSDDSTDTD